MSTIALYPLELSFAPTKCLVSALFAVSIRSMETERYRSFLHPNSNVPSSKMVDYSGFISVKNPGFLSSETPKILRFRRRLRQRPKVVDEGDANRQHHRLGYHAVTYASIVFRTRWTCVLLQQHHCQNRQATFTV